MTATSRAVTILGEGGPLLEGRLDLPDDAHLPAGEGPRPVPGVVLCHPHPLYGGSMDDQVLHTLATRLAALGVATLRFNFRGVGASEGSHDGGLGETDDALAALSMLSHEAAIDADRIGLAGYSFGAGVAAKAAVRQPTLTALALVACPPGSLETQEARRDLAVPKLLVVGSEDRMVSPDRLQAVASALRDPTEVHIIRGADHFFGGFDEELGEPVARFFAAWLLPGAQ
jgi:alpha/beta superfamily hydrolase